MKVGIYSPYLDTVGGGEKYMLTIAESLSKDNSVDVFLDSHLKTLNIKSITEKITKLLNINLAKINFINAPFGKGANVWGRLNFLKQYDILFYLTDGSIFYSSARKSILHIQSPIIVSNKSLLKRINSSSWDLIIYNSQFTKIHCEKLWKVKGEVIYPPVNTELFKPSLKKKQILTVGRFFGFLKDKKHNLMINSFKKMYDSKKVNNWSFHLAGGVGDGDDTYLKELQEISYGYPIHIHPNIAFSDLKNLYSESSIYWHASGFGETDPTRMEHFGITTVEAMASGCVPVVINLGGQKEIVDEDKNGLLWNTPEEMQSKTLKLIGDETLMTKFSKAAQEKSQAFSKEKFENNISRIVKNYG